MKKQTYFLNRKFSTFSAMHLSEVAVSVARDTCSAALLLMTGAEVIRPEDERVIGRALVGAMYLACSVSSVRDVDDQIALVRSFRLSPQAPSGKAHMKQAAFDAVRLAAQCVESVERLMGPGKRAEDLLEALLGCANHLYIDPLDHIPAKA